MTDNIVVSLWWHRNVVFRVHASYTKTGISLEGDASLGIASVDSEYNIAMPPKTHNDIVSHFEFAGLKKRAALDKLASSDCDGLRM